MRGGCINVNSLSLENAIKRALNCEANQFGGIVLASEIERNAYLGLVSALAPYYRYSNYRNRIDDILMRFVDTKGERFSSGSLELMNMADEINDLLTDIERDNTIV